MIQILITILLAILAYWVIVAVGLPSLVAVVAAVIILIVGIAGAFPSSRL